MALLYLINMFHVSYLLTLFFLAPLRAHTSVTQLRPVVQGRNAPGKSVEDTYDVIRRELAMASLEKRGNFSDTLSISRSWRDATIIMIEVGTGSETPNTTTEITAGITVQCKYCYVRGNALAVLTIDENFNASQAIENTMDQVGQNFVRLGEEISDYLGNYTDGILTEIKNGDLDWSDFDLPTFPYNFDLDVPAIPETNLRFQFDSMELYMEMETTFNAEATYEINLFTSQSAVGIQVGKLQLGIVLTVDLILSVDGEIVIDSGFHVQLDDGVELNIALFGDKVSDMTFNGGQFEFLPVTVQSAGVTLSAALRVGISCGIAVSGDFGKSLLLADIDVGVGMEVAVYANVAEFSTTVKHDSSNMDCGLQVVQEYQFAVGAAAGASVEIALVDISNDTLASASLGAIAEAEIAIFTTTLAEICAVQRTQSAIEPTVTPSVRKRDDLTETTLTTTITNSAIFCTITGIANCPVSAQISTSTTVVQTTVTAVPSDWDSEYPQATLASVASLVPFSKANKIQSTNGSPTMYTAVPTDGSDHSGEIGGVSKKLIIGVSVGVGVPVTLAAIAGLLFMRRRKQNAAPSTPMTPGAEPFMSETGYSGGMPGSKKAFVNVNEIGR